MKRIVEVSERGVELRLDNGQIKVALPDGTVRFIAIRDIGALVLSERAVSLSAAALSELAAAGILTVLCDARHSPVGILAPFGVKSDQTRVMQAQVSASLSPMGRNGWTRDGNRKGHSRIASARRRGCRVCPLGTGHDILGFLP